MCPLPKKELSPSVECSRNLYGVLGDHQVSPNTAIEIWHKCSSNYTILCTWVSRSEELQEVSFFTCWNAGLVCKISPFSTKFACWNLTARHSFHKIRKSAGRNTLPFWGTFLQLLLILLLWWSLLILLLSVCLSFSFNFRNFTFECIVDRINK